MPRTQIETSSRLEYLSILDEDGVLDEALEPELSTGQLLEMHRVMLLSRRFAQRVRERRGEVCPATTTLGEGLEAAQVGAVAALDDADWVVPSHRDVAARIWRGASLFDVLPDHVAGSSVHGDHPMRTIPVGALMLHAAGLAYGFAQQGTGAVVVALVGDDSTSHADLQEAMRFAAGFRSPLVLIGESAPGVVPVLHSRERPKTTLQMALEHDIHCVRVDGNDVLAVLAAAREAVERARRARTPTFVECVTYRFSVHTPALQALSAAGIVQADRHDPVSRFQAYLRAKAVLLATDVQALEDEIDAQITGALDAGSAAEDLDPSVMIACVTGEIPRHLKKRRPPMMALQGARESLK